MGVTQKKRRRIFARDEYTCRYCDLDMKWHFPYPHLGVITVDHIVPKVYGGTDRNFGGGVHAFWGCCVSRISVVVARPRRGVETRHAHWWGGCCRRRRGKLLSGGAGRIGGGGEWV
jgi:5-methylcytosine-specific restriction endonuclease McrA